MGQNAPAPLYAAALQGDVVAVSALLEAKEDMQATDKVPTTIKHEALILPLSCVTE